MLKQQKFIYGAIFLLANRLQLLSDQLEEEITTKQYFFLVTLSQFENHVPTLTELAQFMACSRQNVKKLAVILEEKKMVNILKDEQDKRSSRIQLTDLAKEYVTVREEVQKNFYDELFANINDVTLEYMESGLLKLAQNLTKMENQTIDTSE